VKSPRCENGSCEVVPNVDNRELVRERSSDEVHYGRLWAEVELPKLLRDEKSVERSSFVESIDKLRTDV